MSYGTIKEIADVAVKVQNKAGMEAALMKIIEICAEVGKDLGSDGPIEAGDVLVAADGRELKVEAVVETEKPKRGKRGAK